ncbi:Histone-lysine N-methyltransferase smyd1, partial [Blyttiomyces sp. JEL0837]
MANLHSDIPKPRLDQISDALIHEIRDEVIKRESFTKASPTNHQILRSYFALECNSFQAGLNLHLSLVNHSCNPNCNVTEHEIDTNATTAEQQQSRYKYHLTTIKQLNPGDELSISYMDLENYVELAEDRQRHLEQHYLFQCRCDLCFSNEDNDGPRMEELRCLVTVEILLDGDNKVEETKNGNNRFTPLLVQESLSSICDGPINRISGTCKQCGTILPAKERAKRIEKADKLLVKIRETITEIQGILIRLDEVTTTNEKED